MLGRAFTSAPGLSPEQESGLLGEPFEAIYVAASVVAAPQRPPAALVQDRLPVFELTDPAAVTSFLYSSHLLVFWFRWVPYLPHR